MSDELLPYYEKELAYIRQLGKEFSEQHPKIASRLGIADDTIEDPHVSRLIESFAYLNARIQYKLEDDFPEISDAFLNVLYPHYLRQIPSCSVIQFNPDEEKADSVSLISEKSYLDTPKFNDTQCRFKTIYPVEMLPLSLNKAQIKCRPFSTPGSKHARGAGSVLHLQLKAINNDFEIHELSFENIRFYLKGQPQYIHPFYELLFRNCHGIAMTHSEDDLQPIYLDKNSIKQVGFKENEGLLPYPNHSFIGYRLLTEFFVFPEKFMFIDFNEICSHLTEDYKDEINLYVYLDSADLELERNINKDNMLLGCSPVINLFPVQAEPVKLTHYENSYEIIPDLRQYNSLEVYSVDDVSVSDASGSIKQYTPFYGKEHDLSENSVFWNAERKYKQNGNKKNMPKISTHVSLSDINFNPASESNHVLLVETICCNHDYPSIISIGSEQSDLYCISNSPPTSNIQFLHQPTTTIYPPLKNKARWRLLSHLNLNYLSLTSDDDSASSLKEIMNLYDFTDRRSTKLIIESISNIVVKQTTAPLKINGRASLCNGLDITIEIDQKLLSGVSGYLLASVLEMFFTLYCPINSFVRCTTKLKGKEGFLKTCLPQSGSKRIL